MHPAGLHEIEVPGVQHKLCWLLAAGCWLLAAAGTFIFEQLRPSCPDMPGCWLLQDHATC